MVRGLATRNERTSLALPRHGWCTSREGSGLGLSAATDLAGRAAGPTRSRGSGRTHLRKNGKSFTEEASTSVPNVTEYYIQVTLHSSYDILRSVEGLMVFSRYRDLS